MKSVAKKLWSVFESFIYFFTKSAIIKSNHDQSETNGSIAKSSILGAAAKLAICDNTPAAYNLPLVTVVHTTCWGVNPINISKFVWRKQQC